MGGHRKVSCFSLALQFIAGNSEIEESANRFQRFFRCPKRNFEQFLGGGNEWPKNRMRAYRGAVVVQELFKVAMIPCASTAMRLQIAAQGQRSATLGVNASDSPTLKRLQSQEGMRRAAGGAKEILVAW